MFIISPYIIHYAQQFIFPAYDDEHLQCHA
jgi:hypothetical protein